MKLAGVPFPEKLATWIGVAVLGSGATVTGVMWAATEWGDETFATDEDLATLSLKVSANTEAIDDAREAIDDTHHSVDQLTLLVLDSQISDIEARIRDLEAKTSLTAEEQQSMAELRRRLADLQTQRQALFMEMMSRQ